MDELKEALPGGWVSVLVVILLGALGSAAWEVFMKPTLSRLRDLFLSFFTLWKVKLKDRIYYEISYGVKKNQASLLNTELLFLIFIPVLLVSFFYLKSISYDMVEEQRGRALKVEDRAWASLEYAEPEELTVINTLTEIEYLLPDIDKLSKLAFWQIVLFGGYAAFVVGSLLSKFTRTIYIQNASGHLEKMLAIARPFITSEKYIEYLGQYASIREKAHFVSLAEQLYSVANTNNAWHPTFRAW